MLAEIRDNIAGTTPSGEVKNMQVLLGEIAQAISDNPPSPAPETFEVTITAQGEVGSYTFSADKTYSEIMTAINADSKVAFTITADGESRVSPGYYVFINADDVSDKRIMVAWGSWYPLGKMGTLFLGINSDNEIQMITMEEVTQP